MKMKLLAVLDVQAQAFNRPIFVVAVGVGTRLIADEVNRAAADNPLFNHTEDFRVFDVGSWDDQTGLFSCPPQPVLICDCVALKSQ